MKSNSITILLNLNVTYHSVYMLKYYKLILYCTSNDEQSPSLKHLKQLKSIIFPKTKPRYKLEELTYNKKISTK